MDGMVDTLKTAGAGVTATWINCFKVLPEIVSVSVAVGIATLVYLVIKIRKEL